MTLRQIQHYKEYETHLLKASNSVLVEKRTSYINLIIVKVKSHINGT